MEKENERNEQDSVEKALNKFHDEFKNEQKSVKTTLAEQGKALKEQGKALEEQGKALIELLELVKSLQHVSDSDK